MTLLSPTFVSPTPFLSSKHLLNNPTRPTNFSQINRHANLQQSLTTHTTTWSMTTTNTHPPNHKLPRRKLLRVGLAVALGLTASTVSEEKVYAADGIEGAISKFFFPKKGFNVDDNSLDKGKVVKNLDAMGKEKVKKSLGNLKELFNGIKNVRGEFEGDPKMFDVGSNVKKIVGGVAKLREDLNNVNEVFDEDTQKKTDRLVRGIIQDVEEVEVVSLIKGGGRTEKKIERTRDWLTKVQGDFEKLLGLYE